MIPTIDDCRVVKLPTIHTPQGDITVVEGTATVPFEIARVYYLYDMPAESSRGGHAHKELQQLIICVMGSFDLIVDDGKNRRSITLRRASEGLLVPRMIWRELVNFSSGAICFTLASLPYQESDYIRDYEEFRRYKAGHGAVPGLEGTLSGAQTGDR